MVASSIREFPHPSRLTGDAAADLAALHEYVWSLFRVVFLERGGLVQNDDIGGLAGTDIIASDDIQDFAVILSKLQQIAADRILGRASAGTGVVELLTCTAAGRALLDDANAGAQRTTLGLGALATANTVGTGQIEGGAVTFPKIQDVATDRLIGRLTAGNGSVEAITLSAGARKFITDEIPALKSYTVATLPSASTYARGLIYVSNEAGGAVVAFSDGTNWRRVTDRAIVS